MEIIHLTFEKTLLLHIKEQQVSLVAFKTDEAGNIKFGIQAPSSIRVNREEVQNRFSEGDSIKKE